MWVRREFCHQFPDAVNARCELTNLQVTVTQVHRCAQGNDCALPPSSLSPLALAGTLAKVCRVTLEEGGGVLGVPLPASSTRLYLGEKGAAKLLLVRCSHPLGPAIAPSVSRT